MSALNAVCCGWQAAGLSSRGARLEACACAYEEVILGGHELEAEAHVQWTHCGNGCAGVGDNVRVWCSFDDHECWARLSSRDHDRHQITVLVHVDHGAPSDEGGAGHPHNEAVL